MIEFNKEGLSGAQARCSRPLKIAIRDFFNRPEVIELLNNNDFETLYDAWLGNTQGWSPRPMTLVLLLSGIDFLPYLKTIPYNCFYNLPISYIKIPKSITLLEHNCFDEMDTSVIHYEGTMGEFSSKIYKDSGWDSGINKIICSDGVVSL